MVVQIVTYARNKWRKEEEKKIPRARRKKNSLSRAHFSSSSNHTTTSFAVTVVSSIIILLHHRLLLSCTNDRMCLDWLSPILFVSLVSSSLFSTFSFYYSVALEEKRPCLLSLTPLFIHSFDLSRNNIQRTRRKKNNNISFMLGCNTIINIEQESFSYLLSKVENWSLFNLRLI
jgi:hypothetical protein